MFVMLCQYFSESGNMWQTDGMVPLPETSAGQAVCSTRHLTVFGASLLVPPQSVTFTVHVSDSPSELHQLTNICIIVQITEGDLFSSRRHQVFDTYAPFCFFVLSLAGPSDQPQSGGAAGVCHVFAVLRCSRRRAQETGPAGFEAGLSGAAVWERRTLQVRDPSQDRLVARSR